MAKFMVRINEAARRVGLSTEAVRAIIRRHEEDIPVLKINERHVVVSLPALLEHLQERGAR
jgi:DNA-binding Lrp family transcriptional regulator